VIFATNIKKNTEVKVDEQFTRDKGNMPPFGGSRSKAQIDNLVAYVQEFGQKATRDKKSP
jgi:mono/diheme cytochrome c family protein